MKRSTWLVIAINVYGITAALLAILGILRTPIIIVPFILTPLIIDPLHRLLTNRRHRLLSVATIGVLLFAIVSLVYLVLMRLT